ncbi:MAG TPA: type II toxin-antitoxin system RelE/ParE family toxin [Terriglobia bacterium]|jgi:plasmid stabilization system protein ParE
MKRYAVAFEESAQADVRESYDWGCRVWGKSEAQRWVRQLRSVVLKQQRVTPKGFPIAPESDEFPEEIREVIAGRYRVLFTIIGHTVHVLHVRGAYIPTIKTNDSVRME